MTVSPPTLPPNVKTDLLHKMYMVKTSGPGGYQDSFTFYFRDSSQGSISFQVGDNDPFKVDGNVVGSILFEPAKGSGDSAYIYPGSDTMAILSQQTLGRTYKQSAGMSGPDTPFRVLEKIGGINGYYANTLVVDESVASAGSGSDTLDVLQGEKVIYTWGISQDSLGTSPHDSYIELLSENGALVHKARGAVNPYGVLEFIAERVSPMTIKYVNGDSVAHWFLANIAVLTL